MFERSNLSSILCCAVLCCTVKSQESFYTIVELPEGEHQYKFLVDGSWRHSDHTPTVDNKMGSLNNLVVVHATDFEVCRSAPLSYPALPCPAVPLALHCSVPVSFGLLQYIHQI